MSLLVYFGWAAGAFADPPPIDLPTPLTIAAEVTGLAIAGRSTEMTIDGD